MTAMSSNHFLPLGAALILGCCCLTNAWAGKVPPKNASDYGSSSSQNTECSGPATVDWNGVTATCFTGSGSFPDSFLFNFTVDSPSNQTSSFSVTSFSAADLDGFSDFALLDGCSSSSSTGDPVPCDPNTTLPFDVNGALGHFGETFTFSGFTGNQSGNVTVVFDCAVGAVCSEPLITNISVGTTTTTPEPRFYAFLTLAILLGAGLFRHASFSL